MPPTDTLIERIQKAAVGYIASADIKATAVLAVAGALAALNGPAFQWTAAAKPSLSVQIALLTFAAFDVAAIVAAIVALKPRTDRLAMLGATKAKKSKVPPAATATSSAAAASSAAKPVESTAPLPRSFSYFNELAELDYDSFVKHISKADEYIEQDMREQALIACCIARRKMKAMACAVWCLGGALIALATAVGLAVLKG